VQDLALVRWPWSQPSETPPARLVERVEELEDKYNRLTRRFDRLQGEFNALNRASYDDDDELEEAADR